jgi:threonyl-tRNA synthetase
MDIERADHRALGRRLDLFHFQEEAPGMVFWHPRGFILLRLLEEAVRAEVARLGFVEVRTPQLLRRPIWEASGHWQNFADVMFMIGEEGALKPVNCPAHLELMRRMPRRLPVRIAELGLVHRNEASGALHGLLRLRQFVQDDGHILLREDQAIGEVGRFCRSLLALYRRFGFEQVEVAFSTRPVVRAPDEARWDRAESLLGEAAREAGLALQPNPGQGAFYGPKLEFLLRDASGRAWQCGTIQLDLVLPSRFGLEGSAMLHRAILGSLERFLGLVLERYGRALPAWLAPEQVRVLPVSGHEHGYAERLVARVRRSGLRAEIDPGPETLSRRILAAHEDGVPHILIAGRRELESGSASLRGRDGQSRSLPQEEACLELASLCRPPDPS